MPAFGATELIIIVLIFSVFALPVAALIHLYGRGGQTRDLLVWAAITLILPVLGPIAVFLFYRPRSKEKRK